MEMNIKNDYATSELVTEYTTEISVVEFSQSQLVTNSTTNMTMETDNAEILKKSARCEI